MRLAAASLLVLGTAIHAVGAAMSEDDYNMLMRRNFLTDHVNPAWGFNRQDSVPGHGIETEVQKMSDDDPHGQDSGSRKQGGDLEGGFTSQEGSGGFVHSLSKKLGASFGRQHSQNSQSSQFSQGSSQTGKSKKSRKHGRRRNKKSHH